MEAIKTASLAAAQAASPATATSRAQSSFTMSGTSFHTQNFHVFHLQYIRERRSFQYQHIFLKERGTYAARKRNLPA